MQCEAPLHIETGQDKKTTKAVNPVPSESVTLPLELILPYVETQTKHVLEEKDRKISELTKEIENANMGCANLVKINGQQAIEIKRLNTKLLELNYSYNDSFNYFLDTRTFKGSNDLWLKNLWDNMLSLVMMQTDNGDYLINTAADIAPIYISLKELPNIVYKFCATNGDFEYGWNKNVADRIPDVSRQKKLRLKKNRLKTILNPKTHVWKIPMSEWRIKLLEGVHTKVYERALEIKNIIENWQL